LAGCGDQRWLMLMLGIDQGEERRRWARGESDRAGALNEMAIFSGVKNE